MDSKNEDPNIEKVINIAKINIKGISDKDIIAAIPTLSPAEVVGIINKLLQKGLFEIYNKGGSLIYSFLGFICILLSSMSTAPKGAYFSWIAMIAFWFTGILLGLYLFHLIEKLYKIPWLKIELLFCGVWTLLYLIAACIATSVHDKPHAEKFFQF